MYAKGITKVTRHADLGSTPARVNRKTGEVQINLRMWRQLPKEHRVFVLLHEMGHLVTQSTDEITADEWAFSEYAKLGYSLKESIYALTKVLDFSNPEHHWRAYLQLERAKDYDYYYYGNKDIYKNEKCFCKSLFCNKKHNRNLNLNY